MTSLDQFTDRGTEPPEVIRGEPVTHRHHESGDRTVVGHFCRTNYGRGYMTQRSRSDHLYGQYNSDPESWAVSVAIYKQLKANDVEVVLVFDTEEETCYSYGIELFSSENPYAFIIDFEDGDEQVAVPIENAITWDATEVTLQL